ncbi:MAG: ABC transporter ATP-binding protein [Corynebacterium sp.]|nr:ABC transporter ATP-binding protein [Corynebacterium sp.]
MHQVARILQSAKALWPLYVGVIVSALIITCLGIATPFIVRDATDTIVDALNGTSNMEDARHHVLWLALLLLLTQLANTIFSNLGGYIGDVLAARLRQILSTRYFAQLLAMPQRYFDTQITGTIIARLDRSISTMTQALQTLSNNILPMLVTLGAVLGIATFYYWPLAVMLVLIIPIYMWLTARTSVRWQKLEGEKNTEIDQAGGRFAETVGQVKVVKSFVTEVPELKTFGEHYQRTVATTRVQSRFWHLMDIARGASMNLMFFGIYLILFLRTLEGHFSIGDFVLLIQLVNMARQPLMMMSWVVDTSQRAIAGSRDYFEVMERTLEPTANRQLVAARSMDHLPELDTTPPQPIPANHDIPVIEFSHVDFAYDADENEGTAPQVLSDISFSAHANEQVALVAASGGGKSTIVNLLLGLYQPQAGSLKVFGHDVADIDAAQLRATVGVVFQEPALFSGTIAENIAYARPEAKKADIIEVAKRANAHEFIMEFPDDYDTIIGERGLRLSGGQKQRIAIARAMLKNAPILILDEATSALDTRSELAVQAGLEDLMQGRTTIMIAHRLSTIADVDTIITLEHGQIAEMGSPDQLATSGGLYSELLQLTANANSAAKQRLKQYGFHS